MKKLYVLMTLMLLMMGLLAGCGSEKQEAAGKHLNAALYWFGESVDPAHEWDGWTVTRIGAGETLVTVSDKMDAAAYVADTIYIMQSGRFVEHGRAEDVLHRPAHPYTRVLLDAVPYLT